MENISGIYEALLKIGFIDSNFAIADNDIQDNNIFSYFMKIRDIYDRLDFLESKIIKFVSSNDIINLKDKTFSQYKDSNSNERKIALIIKNIIFLLNKKLLENHSKELAKLINDIKYLYYKYIESNKSYYINEPIGRKREQYFFDNIKGIFDQSENIIILHSSKFDDIANGYDFSIFYIYEDKIHLIANVDVCGESDYKIKKLKRNLRKSETNNDISISIEYSKNTEPYKINKIKNNKVSIINVYMSREDWIRSFFDDLFSNQLERYFLRNNVDDEDEEYRLVFKNKYKHILYAFIDEVSRCYNIFKNQSQKL